MEEYKDVVVSAAEFLKDRLYFVTLRTSETPKSTPCTHYFSTDEELCYESFLSDFGPLNLSKLYYYCLKLKRKFKTKNLLNKRLVHFTRCNKEERLNAAFLIASYAVIYLNFTPQQAYATLEANNTLPYAEFRDASVGSPLFTISILDCLNAIHKALSYGFFNFENFDAIEYEYYERVENGDLNWIVPEKFIGFCGPRSKSQIDFCYTQHAPESYFSYFRRHNITTIVRLNKKLYDSNEFVSAGFEHKDLYFVDGSTPSDKIMNQFISICEKTSGGVAVHCKAGLGRTGTLIGCYIMKHYKFTAREAIAWIRICRPGSIIGHQQQWLESKQAKMWKDGEVYRQKMGMDGPIKHSRGIYSFSTPETEKKSLSRRKAQVDNVSNILEKVDTMKLNDREEKLDKEVKIGKMTQGDKLNQIKAQRSRVRPVAVAPPEDRRLYRARVVLTPTVTTSTVIRSGKLNVVKNSSASVGARVSAKRNEVAEVSQGDSVRRTSHRKLPSTSLSITKPKLTESLTKRMAKKKSAFNWIASEDILNHENSTVGKQEESNNMTVKRGKRSLNTEKLGPHSVKVLRRSQVRGSSDALSKSSTKIRLPLVKINTKTS